MLGWCKSVKQFHKVRWEQYWISESVALNIRSNPYSLLNIKNILQSKSYVRTGWDIPRIGFGRLQRLYHPSRDDTLKVGLESKFSNGAYRGLQEESSHIQDSRLVRTPTKKYLTYVPQSKPQRNNMIPCVWRNLAISSSNLLSIKAKQCKFMLKGI